MFAAVTIHQAYQQLCSKLYDLYEYREAEHIAGWVMENISGLAKMDRMLNKNLPLSVPQKELYEEYSSELLTHKPVQYVLHEAWFYGMHLFVDENVLIPRPETEELVDWVIREIKMAQSGPKQDDSKLTILDIGTGSGCIAIAIKKNLPHEDLLAIDLSEGALQVAQKNAKTQGVSIRFMQLDFLNESDYEMIPPVDIIISNPPYIPLFDKAGMQKNVLEFEPHLALFTGDNDPLVFYEKIAVFARKQLKAGGRIFVEVPESNGQQVAQLFSKSGFGSIELRKDMQGKERMIRIGN
jgi:release factor glutamine methyltransferase